MGQSEATFCPEARHASEQALSNDLRGLGFACVHAYMLDAGTGEHPLAAKPCR